MAYEKQAMESLGCTGPPKLYCTDLPVQRRVGRTQYGQWGASYKDTLAHLYGDFHAITGTFSDANSYAGHRFAPYPTATLGPRPFDARRAAG